MTRPAHQLVTYRGQIITTAGAIEEWSFGLRLQADAGMSAFSDTQMDALAEGARLCYAENIAPIMKTETVLTEVRWADMQVNAAGTKTLTRKRADGSFLQGIKETPTPGTGNGTVNLPLQTALVASLGTAGAGARAKGRIFLPWPHFDLFGPERRISGAQAKTVADAVAELIRDINSISGGGDVIVASTFGEQYPVTHVRVGTVPDTQRSRRNRRPELYEVTAL